MATGKTRKKRKPMTEEQRTAASKRLAIARAKKKPAQYKNIHPTILALDDDDAFSMVSVKEYIKQTKDKITGLRTSIRLKEKGAIAEMASVMAYKRHCEQYLKDGIWSLDFVGVDEERRVGWKTIAPAFDSDGIMKTGSDLW